MFSAHFRRIALSDRPSISSRAFATEPKWPTAPRLPARPPAPTASSKKAISIPATGAAARQPSHHAYNDPPIGRGYHRLGQAGRRKRILASIVKTMSLLAIYAPGVISRQDTGTRTGPA